jgi:hypothetical protein
MPSLSMAMALEVPNVCAPDGFESQMACAMTVSLAVGDGAVVDDALDRLAGETVAVGEERDVLEDVRLQHLRDLEEVRADRVDGARARGGELVAWRCRYAGSSSTSAPSDASRGFVTEFQPVIGFVICVSVPAFATTGP